MEETYEEIKTERGIFKFVAKGLLPHVRNLGYMRLNEILRSPVKQRRVMRQLARALIKATNQRATESDRYWGRESLPMESMTYQKETMPSPDVAMQDLHKRLGITMAPQCIQDANRQLSTEADGFFPLPSLTVLGNMWGIRDPYGTGHSALCQKLLELLSPLYYHRIRNGIKRHLARGEVTVEAQTQEDWEDFELVYRGEKGLFPYHLLPITTGHVFGKNVRTPADACDTVVNKGDLSLTLAHILIILMAWPERLMEPHHRWLCATGSIVTDLDTGTERAAYFLVEDDQVLIMPSSRFVVGRCSGAAFVIF